MYMDLQERRLPCHIVCSSHVLVTFFPIVTFVLLPTAVVVLVEIGDAYLLLFLGQLMLAVAVVEWSWLAFRIRQRLLLAITIHDDDILATKQETGELEQQIQEQEIQEREDQPVLTREDSRERYARQLNESMRVKSFAIDPMVSKICCGRWYIAALLLSLLGAVVSVVLAYALNGNNPASGWHMTIGASVEAAFVSIFCSSLAPSATDAVVLIIYQICVLVASMNAFVKLQLHFIASDAQIEPLFIILVGAIIIIVFRVVTSKVVMQSLLLVLCDMLGLVCIVSPLIAFADLMDETMSQSLRNQLALFVLVVLAADVGDTLAKELQLHWPLAFKWCRPPLLKSGAITKHIEASIISMTCGAVMFAAVRLGSDGSDFSFVEVVVLFGAIAIGQWCRQWMTHVRQMAKVLTSAFYFPVDSRSYGVLDRMAVFLAAIVVYYPYIKQCF
ncbi:hypothetical protein KXD40_001492 [Peronospora effusa]|uniref:Uncharacterized protein n=1 Tax=Peronospora effusa TaxID=542832 RepID=A0A3M6VLQ1_9STRA|nr:hypothetical protein DD238_001144 [Peronospora effusa]RQM13827.1 hypothetical protein DD237_002025 [Peronospora effusa]UIZ26216.1 hypothetical protein KXD40_001492 [Peronospora effusa]CAI5711160.1 unnamed protein product [Peronospora effusa]